MCHWQNSLKWSKSFRNSAEKSYDPLTMTIHSGGILFLLTYLMTFAFLISLVVCAAMLIAKKFRLAGRVLAVSLAAIGVFFLSTAAAYAFWPQRVINTGDSYCWDLFCMGVEKVDAAPRALETEYKVDVRIFSDANTVKTGPDEAVVYLQDERGRRFSLVNDAGAALFKAKLDPKESRRATLTFVVPSGTKAPLFLTGDAPLPENIPLQWHFFRFFADLHFGYEKLSWKPTLLRVL